MNISSDTGQANLAPLTAAAKRLHCTEGGIVEIIQISVLCHSYPSTVILSPPLKKTTINPTWESGEGWQWASLE